MSKTDYVIGTLSNIKIPHCPLVAWQVSAVAYVETAMPTITSKMRT